MGEDTVNTMLTWVMLVSTCTGGASLTTRIITAELAIADTSAPQRPTTAAAAATPTQQGAESRLVRLHVGKCYELARLQTGHAAGTVHYVMNAHYPYFNACAGWVGSHCSECICVHYIRCLLAVYV